MSKLTINIENESETRLDIDYDMIIRKVIVEALDYLSCPYEAKVEVCLVDNEQIHEINKEQRDIDRATDVLSFPMINFNEAGNFADMEEELTENEQDYFDPDSGELLLGDIVISLEKVIEQAEAYGHSKTRELAFLVAHSMLHLAGFDHMIESEAEIMTSKQNEILERIGYTRDYID